MTIPLIALAAKPVPVFCSNLIKTPAQWKACWDAGYSQPANTTVANAGHAVGTGAIPAIVLIVIILAVIALARRRSGSPATN